MEMPCTASQAPAQLKGTRSFFLFCKLFWDRNIRRTYFGGFPDGSCDKESACNAGDGFDPWVRKIPWRRAWQPTPVFWPGESYGWRSLAGYSPCGHTESDMTEHACISCYILVCVCMLSRVWLFATPWTVVHQAPLSMGILQARILYCHALLQGNLPNPGIKPRSPQLQEDSLPSEPPGKPIIEKEIKHTLWDCSFYIPYVVILERSVELYCLDSILTSSCYLNPQKKIQRANKQMKRCLISLQIKEMHVQREICFPLTR